MRRIPLSRVAREGILKSRVFTYNGHEYVLISNDFDKQSKHANTTVDEGFFACMNIKSHTIRGIAAKESVIVSRNTLRTNHWPEPKMKRTVTKMKRPSDRLMSPEEIRLREGYVNHRQLNEVQRAISSYLTNKQDEIFENDENHKPDNQVVVDCVLNSDVRAYLFQKGFVLESLYETQRNDAFYPPTKTVEVGTRIRW